MVKKVLLVAFASLSLSLAAPVPAKEDLPPTEAHHRQPRPFFTFDNSIPGTTFANQTIGGPKFNTLFPNFPLPWSVVLPPIPGISGTGLLNDRNLIKVFTQTNAATNATLGYYLINPFENYNLNDIIGLINGNARSVDESSLDAGSNSDVSSLNVQQLNELMQMYNQRLTSVGQGATDVSDVSSLNVQQLNELMQMYNQRLTSVRQGATFNTPNLLPVYPYSPYAQGSPYNTNHYLSQYSQYNPYAVPNSNAIFAPYAALNAPLPGQETALSGLPFGITAPINGLETAGEVSAGVEKEGDSRKAEGSKA